MELKDVWWRSMHWSGGRATAPMEQRALHSRESFGGEVCAPQWNSYESILEAPDGMEGCAVEECARERVTCNCLNGARSVPPKGVLEWRGARSTMEQL